MNGRRLTDAQISEALRAQLPDRAYPGLRERILDAAETTAQQRVLPSVIGALGDADPVVRRRSLLIAAALLVALALASVAAVGALRLLERDPVKDLSLEPPADIQAFVLSSYERLPQLPPLALTWQDSGSPKGRVYVDRSGAVRFDRFTSADATEPSSYTILSDHRVSGVAPVGSGPVWVEQGEEAIGDDPRVFLRTVLRADDDGPGCEMERDPSAVGNGTAASGWRYVGAEYVAGRPTHHVACVGDLALDIDLWLDVETRLILRTRAPLTDDAGQVIPGQFRTREVTEIAFGEQPAVLFEPPQGFARISAEAYSTYLCTHDLPDEERVGLGAWSECPPPEAEATSEPEPSPTPTVRPTPSDCAVASHDPSEPIGPLGWTQASLTQDWPAPVRPEPAGGASVLPMPPTYIDPSGDTGPDFLPCVDIRDLTVGVICGHCGTFGMGFTLVSNQPPDVDPSKVWIAYGVVLDDDRDGVPDWRYGIDNAPRTAGDEQGHHRAWRTNLHTGRTESAPGSEDGMIGDTFFGTSYPAGASGADARFRFSYNIAVAGKGMVSGGLELNMPLYAWASVIVDGRVVATDYAPDAGWLVTSPGVNQEGTYVLERGAYVDALPFRLSMSVPNGWTAEGSSLYDGPRDDGIRLGFMIVDKPVEWGCDASGDSIEAQVGPKVDDLVTFLASQQVIKISASADVTLDGHPGKYLEYTTAGNDDNCDDSDWPLAAFSWAFTLPDDRQFHQAWILDVDGVRLVIDSFTPKASETVKAEVQRIVESIDIGP
jgi:hypothetical protein